MLQPCPAPVISTLAIAGAGAAIFGAGHGLSVSKAPVVVAAPNPSVDSRQDLTPFEHCTYDGLHTAQTIQFPANGSIIVADLPPSCMDWFAHYNQHPQIDELNEAHSSITTLNSSAVELANLPPYVMKYVESSMLNGTKENTMARVVEPLLLRRLFRPSADSNQVHVLLCNTKRLA